MFITLNHVLVPAHDKRASAQFFADMFGPKSPGSPIALLTSSLSARRDSISPSMDHFEPHQFAFLVSEDDFDKIFARVREAGIEFSAGLMHQKTGQINHNDGGRGLYFRDINGHNIELLTRPQVI